MGHLLSFFTDRMPSAEHRLSVCECTRCTRRTKYRYQRKSNAGETYIAFRQLRVCVCGRLPPAAKADRRLFLVFRVARHRFRPAGIVRLSPGRILSTHWRRASSSSSSSSLVPGHRSRQLDDLRSSTDDRGRFHDRSVSEDRAVVAAARYFREIRVCIGRFRPRSYRAWPSNPGPGGKSRRRATNLNFQYEPKLSDSGSSLRSVDPLYVRERFPMRCPGLQDVCPVVRATLTLCFSAILACVRARAARMIYGVQERSQ